MAGLCKKQSAHLIAQSLQKQQGLLRRGKLASRHGMEQEGLQGRSDGQQDKAGFVFDGGWASSRGMNKTKLQLEDWPLSF